MITGLYQLLFAENQPRSEARQFTGDLILELYVAKLDESLSYLEPDQERRARKEIELTREHGSVENYVQEAMGYLRERGEPDPDILPV